MPLYLSLTKNLSFDRIAAIIEYPPAVTYKGVEVSKEFQENGVAMELKGFSAQPGGKTNRAEINLKAGKGKPLQAGMIGSLLFIVDKLARPQMALLPVGEARGYSVGSGTEVKLRGDAGSMTIYEPGTEPTPVVPCFFFTH